MNALEYIVIEEQIGAPLTERQRKAEQARVQRAAAKADLDRRVRQGIWDSESMVEFEKRLAKLRRSFKDLDQGAIQGVPERRMARSVGARSGYP